MHEVFGRTLDNTLPYPLGDPGDLEPNLGEPRTEDPGPVRLQRLGLRPAGRHLHPQRPTEVGQITIPETADPDFHRRLR